MNIEALTLDINAALEKHGISGPAQTSLRALISIAVAPLGAELINRCIEGATLFAVDDHGSMGFVRSGTQQSGNGLLLNELLSRVSPRDLGEILRAVLDQISPSPTCNCPKCVARRTEPNNPTQKGAIEAAFIKTNRSKH